MWAMMPPGGTFGCSRASKPLATCCFTANYDQRRCYARGSCFYRILPRRPGSGGQSPDFGEAPVGDGRQPSGEAPVHGRARATGQGYRSQTGTFALGTEGTNVFRKVCSSGARPASGDSIRSGEVSPFRAGRARLFHPVAH